MDQRAVYLPDPLWQRLHPVRRATWWYVELQGQSADDEQAELDRMRREDWIRAQPYGTNVQPPAADKNYRWIMIAVLLVVVAMAVYFAVSRAGLLSVGFVETAGSALRAKGRFDLATALETLEDGVSLDVTGGPGHYFVITDG